LAGGLGIDRPVFYALLTRGWQFAAGPVTLLLIAANFPAAMQGYYYTFWSLLALQTFFELGFSVVVIHVASHEWARLKISRGRITGDAASRSRLISLGRLLFKWYAGAGLMFVLVTGAIGVAFFVSKPAPGFSWFWPWVVLVVLNGLLIWVFPFSALLEGCNQVGEVYKLAIAQAVTGHLVVWSMIVGGAGLWTVAGATLVRLLWYLWLVMVRYRKFFAPFWRKHRGPAMHWASELWPMQWRLALQGVFTYCSTWMLTPLLFHYDSPAMAGRMGMTWGVLVALQAGAFAWVQTRAARFGMLVSRRDYQQLDPLWRRMTLLSTAALIAGGAAFWGVLLMLTQLQHQYAVALTGRLLPLLPAGLLVLAAVVTHVVACQTVYLRAHRHDPLLWVTVASSTAIATFAFYAAANGWSATGVAAGYLATSVAFTLPACTAVLLRFSSQR